MYQVIILYNEENTHSYYQHYYLSDNTELGNVTCDELPPYQDINKARACYWDFDNQQWIYDEEMYQKILAENAQREAEEEERRRQQEAQPTIEELSEAVMELANGQSDLEDAITELAGLLAGE